MAANLCSMPLEILIEVCKYFDPSDLVSIVQVNQYLYQRLRGSQPSKFILETVAPSSREAHAAFTGEVTFWEAVKCYYHRTQAFTRASPYSVAVLAGTEHFIYENGFLVYGLNYEIRIRDIHRDVSSEKIIDINRVQKEIMLTVEWNGGLILLYYHADILAFRVKSDGGWRLIVLDLHRKCVKLMADLPELTGLVVRHNGLHLFAAFYSRHYDKHWAIRKFDLLKGMEIGGPTVLDEFGNFGDTSQGVCFEIFSDKLHAISSHATGMELASDRSFYKWICIAPDSEAHRITAKKIFRRYHELWEGILIFAKLSLQVDERTGRPMILEFRNEKRNLEEVSCRTYYGEYLPYPEEFHGGGEQALGLPLLGPTRDELRAYRSDKLVHPEYSSQSCEGPTFSLTNTPGSFYNLSARTFIDLINDPMSNNRDTLPDKRYCLRFNSHKCTDSDKKHIATQLWPTDNNVTLLNPFGTSFENKVIHAKADERSMVYSLTDGEKKAIVLISFDPKIRFPFTHHKEGETLDQWVRIEPATKFQLVWDREIK